MNITKLSKDLNVEVHVYDTGQDLTRIQSHSKAIEPGDVFFPKKGAQVDAIDFAQDVAAQNAGAIVTSEKLALDINQIFMPRDQRTLRKLCHYFYHEPTLEMDVIGVTGTNGKTSVCHFVEAFFHNAKIQTGYMGTTAYRWGNHEVPAKLTTPMYEDVHYYARRMKSDGAQSMVMECSSHGITLGRIDDVHFDVCVFTNLSHEHLDFHKNMQDYAEAKSVLFKKHLSQSKKKHKLAVINIDDSVGKDWASAPIFESITTFGFDTKADIHPVSFQAHPNGMDVTLSVMGERCAFHMPMLGLYNLSNVMAALAVGQWKGLGVKGMIQTIEAGMEVPGRLQKVQINAPFSVIVDYAYTEDALKNVLGTLKPFCQNKLIVVFGCGGNRDASRRPKMAKAVYDIADLAIVTTDNPRFEDPDAIIDEMMEGIAREDDFDDKIIREVDRAQAIARALKIAEPNDIIVIAGKGHETYQEIEGVRHPFNDIDIVTQCWNSK